jgi:hypothetical protein
MQISLSHLMILFFNYDEIRIVAVNIFTQPYSQDNILFEIRNKKAYKNMKENTKNRKG